MKLPGIVLVTALAASGLAWGEPLETPARIARLGYVEGPVAFHAAEELASSALPDRPLIPGDQLVTKTGGRAELALGTATVRLDDNTELSISTLDATTVRVELNQGTVSVHLRELYDDETFAVATPNTTLTLREPGEYRIAVPTEGTTDLTVRGGAAEGVTAGGPVRVAAGQRVRFEGRQALASLVTPRSTDAFDDWVLEREVQFGNLEPSSEQLASGDEYQELDRYGEWYEESSYGRVWMPGYAYGGYDPFRYGHWQHSGSGQIWVNSLPWGHHTFDHGRWAYLDHLNRWCWVPSRRDHRSRDVNPRHEDEEPAPVAATPRTPIPFEGGGQRAYRGDAGSGKTPTRAAPKLRPNAPATQGDAPTTMRPTRPVEARSQPESQPTTRMKGSPKTVEP